MNEHRYRWLDAGKPVRSHARNHSLRGSVGRIVVLPIPGCIANVAVDFEDIGLVVVPAGTLRNVKEVNK